jgi:hypothetical protein
VGQKGKHYNGSQARGRDLEVGAAGQRQRGTMLS